MRQCLYEIFPIVLHIHKRICMCDHALHIAMPICTPRRSLAPSTPSMGSGMSFYSAACVSKMHKWVDVHSGLHTLATHSEFTHVYTQMRTHIRPVAGLSIRVHTQILTDAHTCAQPPQFTHTYSRVHFSRLLLLCAQSH